MEPVQVFHLMGHGTSPEVSHYQGYHSGVGTGLGRAVKVTGVTALTREARFPMEDVQLDL